MREQRTLFDLTQDGWGIGKKIQRIYPKFRFGCSKPTRHPTAEDDFQQNSYRH